MSYKICLICGKPLLSNNESNYHNECLKSFFGSLDIPDINFDDENIDDIAKENILEGDVVAGVQKKVSLSTNSKRTKKHIITNKYIIKPHHSKYPLLNEYEWLGNRLAALSGFNVVSSGLFKYKEKYIYITKRVDRKYVNGEFTKIHMEDFCQLIGKLTKDKYEGSYESPVKYVINKYSNLKQFDKLEYFRMIFFSYIIGNTDMHLKNFSLITNGKYTKLCPFYDIVPVLMIVNQLDMALTINGKSRNITKNDFLKFAENINLDKRLAITAMNSIINKYNKMVELISSSTLNEKEQSKFINFIISQINKF